ncbi:uncharacterized protein N7459_007332 [Penicillium hispanicum]|uniref:uncharacterized protein n=1 Tax=Penicillium hispanicum TaxID=1080232 RepID=UPI002541C0FA|nr:uncharacterized protein N7459_007332 [Penicillium hispanicum]KAJ5578368.1 hypothetical protein N7459_007332 [Penicillium hispanicum]
MNYFKTSHRSCLVGNAWDPIRERYHIIPAVQARKKTLKASLRGIAEMHGRQIVHLDVKPDNIMVDWHVNADEEVLIERVQVTDLENAACLPRGRCIKGMAAGNDNWRSPEAHLRGELNKPTDLFSFGVVCIYAMLGRVIFGPEEDFEVHESKGALPAFIPLQRQVSYFGDQAGIDGLLRHISGDHISCQVLRMLWEDREEDHIPYIPFSEWPDVCDVACKDLIWALTSLDPTRRITARQAVQHRWFVDIE